MINASRKNEYEQSLDHSLVFTRPEFERDKYNLFEMYNNSANIVYDELLESTVKIIPITFSEESAKATFNHLLSNRIHTDGKTDATVIDAAPRAVPAYTEDNILGQVYVPVQAEFVFKDNKNHVLNKLEKTLLNEFKKQGLPVADCFDTTDIINEYTQKGITPPKGLAESDGLYIKHLGYTSLARYITDLGIKTITGNNDSLNKSFNAMTKILDLSDKFDSITKKVVESPEFYHYKKILEKRELERLSKAFGVDEDFSKDNYYSLRLLLDMPGATQEDLKLFEPINYILKQAENECGVWSIGIHPRNVMITGENDRELDFKIIDANRVKYAPVQEFDWQQIDSYTPIRKPMSMFPTTIFDDGPQGFKERLATSILGERVKIEFLGYRCKKYKEETQGDVTLDRYAQLGFVARYYTNLKLAQRALIDLANAKDFHKLIDLPFRYKYHMDAAMKGIGYSIRLFPEFEIEKIFYRTQELMQKSYNKIMTPELIAKIDEWSIRDSIPEGAHNVWV